jgi:4,4'-diaponeurosporenoate glycosyltransferase
MILLGLPLLLGLALIWRMTRWPKAAAPANLPVSIIIPARDERVNIGRLLKSIREQSLRPLEVIVIDDGSQDGTGDVARGLGAEVIIAPPLPTGWRGKTWACLSGARAARGEVLLFLDADIELRPGALAAICSAYSQHHAQALSVGPYHRVKCPYEQLSLMFNILTYAGMGSFAVCGSPTRPAGLFGPFLMIDKGVYFDVGGHEPVKSEILENMSLCPLLAARGVRMLCLAGRGLVDIRMYPDGLRGLIEGWTKAFATGADKAPRAVLLASAVWITGALIAMALPPLALLGWLPLADALSLYTAYALGFLFLARRVGNFSPLTALLYPLPLLFYIFVFGRSLFFKLSGRPVLWKGRSIGVSQ